MSFQSWFHRARGNELHPWAYYQGQQMTVLYEGCFRFPMKWAGFDKSRWLYRFRKRYSGSRGDLLPLWYLWVGERVWSEVDQLSSTQYLPEERYSLNKTTVSFNTYQCINNRVSCCHTEKGTVRLAQMRLDKILAPSTRHASAKMVSERCCRKELERSP